VDPQQLMVKPPDLSDIPPPVYANVVHVSRTPFDFRVTFSLLTTPHDQPSRDAFAPVEAVRGVAEVVLPAAVMDSVLELLRAGLTEYSERFGAPRAVLLASR
jgi:hypothetical protein